MEKRDVFAEAAAERWLPVVGWEPAYEVSDLGNVRSLPRMAQQRNGHSYTVRGRVLKPKIDKKGDARVELSFDGEHSTRMVSHLVLDAFVGLVPELSLDVRHVDGNHSNNALDNLVYATVTESRVRGKDHHLGKLTHCKRKHLLALPNLTPSMLPYRQCLACSRGAAAVRNARKSGRPVPDMQIASDHYYAEIMNPYPLRGRVK